MNSLCALIIENRSIPYLMDIIEAHEKMLPKNTPVYWLNNEPIHSMRDYNALMLSKRLWRNLNAERVLMFQWDSILLKPGIEEFLEWDYIGAPWKFQDWGGNGGLSIRNPKTMMEIIDKGNWDGQLNEDVFISNEMYKSQGTYYQMNLAPREECEKFSVESIYKLGTLGAHAIDVWLTLTECETIRNQYQTKS